MISVFNTEQLQDVLRDFYNITQIRITVFDDRFQELVSYPEYRPEFCQIIRSCEAGSCGCAQCDQNACRIASQRKSTYIYRCHSGLTEAIMPLYVGNVLVGYLLFGHIFAYDSFETGWEIIRKSCANYPVSMDKLKEACKSRPQVSKDYIDSAARILHATASYLAMERMTFLKEESAASKLDEYLSANFMKSLNAEKICKDLNLGRTKLYKLSQQLYGIGPSEQLRNLRINHAKQLLEEQPDLRISEIAQNSGFSDYNYFIAVFSRITGISPSAYRKQKNA